jgi:hypothetical protein
MEIYLKDWTINHIIRQSFTIIDVKFCLFLIIFNSNQW